MDNRDFMWLGVIALIVAAAVWVMTNPNYPIRQGLDLQGGLQVLLEADVPAEQAVSDDDMDAARQIIDQRVNGLGVAEPLVQREGDRRILVELPGIDNPKEAVSLIQETALLEFVDTGSQPLPEGTCIRTTMTDGPSRCELLPGVPLTVTEQSPAPTFETVFTGADLRTAQSRAD
ncbi:MAG: preprotein translocase subunit SecD, partial [Anaerolineae bacterium]